MSVQSHDKTHRFLFDNTDIRGQITTLKQSYQQVLANQNLPEELLPILGEFVAAAALLSETLKFEGILTLQVRGDGNVPLIMTEATHQGHVRGLLKISSLLKNDENGHPKGILFDTTSLRSLVGNGVLTLTIDPTQGHRYQGVVPLEGNNLQDCLSHYFEQSEQLPTRIWLFADGKHCGGLMLQSLPAQTVKDTAQRKELWQTTIQFANTLMSNELFELEHDAILYRLFNELSCRVFPPRDIHFHCSCSRDRSENAISSLNRNDAYALLKEQGKISIDCQFCGQAYAFDKKDIERIFGDNSAVH